MTSSRMNLPVVAAAGARHRAGRLRKSKNPGYQGWVEADMIFVSPDESGRVTKLNVREGDEVKKGAPLYEVDDDLQKADLNQQNATLANAQQTYDRAASLSRTGSGTQANFDAAVSALRVAEARVNTSQTRLARRSGAAPVGGIVQQIYFREGEMVPAQRPVLSIMPPGNMKLRFFAPETDLPKLAVGDEVRVSCDNCAADLTAKIYFIADRGRIHPACDLQPRGAQQAGLSDPGAAEPARRLAGRPADLGISRRQDPGSGQAMTAHQHGPRRRHRDRRARPVEILWRPRGGA